MKKFFNLTLALVFIFLAVFFAGCDNAELPQINIKVLSLGDNIAAGYAPTGTDLYPYYNEYLSGKTQANKKSFTYLIGGNISDSSVKVTSKSYAKSWDKTYDLAEKLNNISVLNDINQAHIITLSIGANNVLKVALDNMNQYINGSITDDEIETLFQTGVDDFKRDYTNTITQILTRSKAKIFIMTVYNPYKYFDLTKADVRSSYAQQVIIANEKFSQYSAIISEYLDQINDYIRSEKFDNIYVVDVNAEFEGLGKDNYAKYINVDSTKIKINSSSDLQNLSSNLRVDPFPTLEGQKYIAELFTNKIMQVVNLEAYKLQK